MDFNNFKNMKKIILILLIIVANQAMSVDLYPVTGGGNYSVSSTWNTASNQSSGNHAAPVATDVVKLDAYAGNVTVDNASAVCASLDMTGYAYTFTCSGTNKITISGNATLGGTLSGDGTIVLHAAGTLASNGITIPQKLTFDANVTYVLSGNAIVTGLVSVTANSTINWTTNETLTCNGGFYNAGVMGSGTAKIIVAGGTLSCLTENSAIQNNLDIAGNVTLGSKVAFKTKTLTYVSGTVNSSSNSNVLYLKGNCTLNTNGINWYNVQLNDYTFTLTSPFTCTNDMLWRGYSPTFAGAYNISCANLLGGSCTANTTLTLVSGTTLTVSTLFSVFSHTLGTYVATITASSTSAANIKFDGTQANDKCVAVAFTYITASSGVINNYLGGTLSNTTNITNVDASNIGSGTVTTWGGM